MAAIAMSLQYFAGQNLLAREDRRIAGEKAEAERVRRTADLKTSLLPVVQAAKSLRTTVWGANDAFDLLMLAKLKNDNAQAIALKRKAALETDIKVGDGLTHFNDLIDGQVLFISIGLRSWFNKFGEDVFDWRSTYKDGLKVEGKLPRSIEAGRAQSNTIQSDFYRLRGSIEAGRAQYDTIRSDFYRLRAAVEQEILGQPVDYVATREGDK